jgi:glycosyltransferase involved in cell wall biosynthesis
VDRASEGIVRVSIIDDAFTGWTGHNASYNFAICEELEKRSVAYRLYANQGLRKPPTEHADVQPTFRHNAHAAWTGLRWLPRQVNRPLQLVVSNYRHNRDLTRRVGPFIEDGEIVLVVIESRYTSFAQALWLSGLSRTRSRMTAVFVVHNVPSNIIQWEMRAVRALARGCRIVLAAHTSDIARLCQDATGLSCEVLPLPFIRPGPIAHRSTGPDEAVAFTYLGIASAEKGFDLLIEAIGHVDDLLASGRISLTVQCNPHEPGERAARLADALRDRAKTRPGIRIVGALSGDDFEREMVEGDVVLIPNRPEFYRHALSGVFAEALAKGKPVIVSDGTYMARELADHGAGLTFEPGSAASLAEAIRQAASTIDDLRSRAAASQQAWLSIHNPARYVDMLFELSRGNEAHSSASREEGAS